VRWWRGIRPAQFRPHAVVLYPLGLRDYGMLSLGLAALVTITRWPLRSQYLFSWDAANFAQALDAYNVAFHRPHPPGYPLYVGAAWLVRAAVHDANTAYVILSLAATAAASVLLLGFAWRLYGREVAVLATGLFVVSPNAWGHSEVAYPYAFLALGAVAVAWCGAETSFGRRDLSLPGAAALGLAGGFRPDLAVFLLPAWLWASYRRGPRAIFVGLSILTLILAAWFVPMVALSGGWSDYLKTVTDYADVWGTPLDAGPVALTVRIGQNVAEVVGFAARSVGPVWGVLLLLAAGRILSPRRLSGEARLQFLVVWLAPALLFYVLVHIGNLGYLLSILPALAIVGALTAVELAEELTGLLGPVHAVRFGLPRLAIGTLVTISCVAETCIFLFSRGPVSLAEIRDVDARLSVTLRYLAAQDSNTTLVLAYDRFAQFQYYLPDYQLRRHLRSVNDLLGPDTRPLNRSNLIVPAGIERVVLPDLDLDVADRATGLQRLEVAHGTWLYDGRVQAGDVVRLGYGFARVVGAGLQAQQSQPAGP